MASAVSGGPGIAGGKHPTAIRVWEECSEVVCSRCGNQLDWARSSPQEMYGTTLPRIMANADVWFTCTPCHAAMPDAPLGAIAAVVDTDGNTDIILLGGDGEQALTDEC